MEGIAVWFSRQKVQWDLI